MNPNHPWLAIAAGVIVIVLLLLYVQKQIKTLRKQALARQTQALKSADTKAHIISSIRVLARSIIAGQVEFSEACIRIKVLLDNFAPELHKHPDYAIFNRIYDSTSHMPTHEARREVDRRFLFKLDSQRWALEAEHEDSIRQAAKKLLNHPLLL